MKKSVMKKWVKALRSGEYHQGRGRLVDDDDNFCCLGVLCDISPASCGEWSITRFGWVFNGSKLLVAPSVIKWAGIKYDTSVNQLILMNDGRRADFATIADYIEQNYERI